MFFLVFDVAKCIRAVNAPSNTQCIYTTYPSRSFATLFHSVDAVEGFRATAVLASPPEVWDEEPGISSHLPDERFLCAQLPSGPPWVIRLADQGLQLHPSTRVSGVTAHHAPAPLPPPQQDVASADAAPIEGQALGLRQVSVTQAGADCFARGGHGACCAPCGHWHVLRMADHLSQESLQHRELKGLAGVHKAVKATRSGR